MKILVYGSLNIDLLFSVDHIVSPGETISSAQFDKSAGGKGANQAAAFAKAGLPVYMAGKTGEDGQFLLNLLKSYGVNTDAVVMYEGAAGQAVIQIDKNGQNSIVLYPGGNGEITTKEIDKTISAFSDGDIIVLQNETSNLKYQMERAKKQGMRICLNPSPFNEKLEDIPLHIANWLFVNEIEGAALAGTSPSQTNLRDIVDLLVKKFPETKIILTAGKEGAFYGFGETREKGEIIDVKAVDTTGAGDTFTGYFICALEKNMGIAQSLSIACKAAGIAVSRKGAFESIPFADEVFDKTC